jgi:hypothetical protein
MGTVYRRQVRFDEPAGGVLREHRLEIRHLPPLPPSPLQGWLDGKRRLGLYGRLLTERSHDTHSRATIAHVAAEPDREHKTLRCIPRSDARDGVKGQTSPLVHPVVGSSSSCKHAEGRGRCSTVLVRRRRRSQALLSAPVLSSERCRSRRRSNRGQLRVGEVRRLFATPFLDDRNRYLGRDRALGAIAIAGGACGVVSRLASGNRRRSDRAPDSSGPQPRSSG